MRVKSGVSLQCRKEQRTPKDKKERTKTIIINKKKFIMKKSAIFFAALVCMMMQTVSTFANNSVTPDNQIPSEIRV